MKRRFSKQSVSRTEAIRALNDHLLTVADLDRGTQQLHQRAIERFLSGLGSRSSRQFLVFSDAMTQRWLVEASRSSSAGYAAQQLQVIDRYLDSLVRAALININPLRELHAQLGNCSWRTITKTVQQLGPRRALQQLRVAPKPSGPVHRFIRDYLGSHRTGGSDCTDHARILNQLDRFLASAGVRSIHNVTTADVDQWVAQMTCRSHERHRQLRIAWRFFSFLQSQGDVNANPVDPVQYNSTRLSRTQFVPYIFTTEQVAAILAAAHRLSPNHLFPLRAEVCHTIFALQYALGLRLGETRRLTIEDIDLKRRALFIRQTKFHKSRYVPFGPKVGHLLRKYLHVRSELLQPVQSTDPLFPTIWRRSVGASDKATLIL